MHLLAFHLLFHQIPLFYLKRSSFWILYLASKHCSLGIKTKKKIVWKREYFSHSSIFGYSYILWLECCNLRIVTCFVYNYHLLLNYLVIWPGNFASIYFYLTLTVIFEVPSIYTMVLHNCPYIFRHTTIYMALFVTRYINT